MVITAGDLTLDTETGELWLQHTFVKVTQREGQFLSVLLKQPNVLFTREALVRIIWGDDTDDPMLPTKNALLNVLVFETRRKLTELNCGATIKTKHGGYTEGAYKLSLPEDK